MRKRRYEMQKCNDNKNILIWDNETGECLGFVAQIKGRLNLQDDIIKDQQTTISRLEKENEQLRKDCSILVQSNQEYRKENEQLRQKIGSYEKLIMNSYEGEEENLDGEFVGRYVIWEDELEDELERWREKYG